MEISSIVLYFTYLIVSFGTAHYSAMVVKLQVPIVLPKNQQDPVVVPHFIAAFEHNSLLDRMSHDAYDSFLSCGVARKKMNSSIPCTVGILHPFIAHQLGRCTDWRIIRASLELVCDSGWRIPTVHGIV